MRIIRSNEKFDDEDFFNLSSTRFELFKLFSLKNSKSVGFARHNHNVAEPENSFVELLIINLLSQQNLKG